MNTSKAYSNKQNAKRAAIANLTKTGITTPTMDKHFTLECLDGVKWCYKEIKAKLEQRKPTMSIAQQFTMLKEREQQAAIKATRKIEKNREERNGYKRPSIGTLCLTMWEHFESCEFIPSLAQAKAHGKEQEWDMTTTTIQYYTWRKFIGVEGRLPKFSKLEDYV